MLPTIDEALNELEIEVDNASPIEFSIEELKDIRTRL